MPILLPLLVGLLTLAAAVPARQRDPADDFLRTLRARCGQAFEGRLINPQPADSAMLGQRLVMHVRGCGDTVRIPFHVGSNRSRTWVFTRTAAGVRLKHDHRHEDGTEDAVTQYGGDARPGGTTQRMAFAADSFTKALIPAARTNVWTVEVTPATFVYQLEREGTAHRFRVEFDLRTPIAAPPVPWGASTSAMTDHQADRRGNVIPGVDVLLADSLHLIAGKRVGLLTNHSGRDRNGTSTVDRLFKAPGVKLTALFGPEHGIRGEAKAGEKVSSGVDAKTGVTVHSLYGSTQIPTPEVLQGVVVLVYDIQDVGARVYTYQWTLALTAASAGKPIIILDRPNPIRADRVEGNLLDLTYRSLVGQHAVALRYGLTPGELLRYLVGTKAINANITVVPMQGYTRNLWYDETGLPRVNPSPNLRSGDAELLYPGTVFFEGTNATEGRGTEAPFTLIGADYLTDHAAMAQTLNGLRLPGVRFDTATRIIEPGYKFGGKTIPMIKVVVTDRNAVRPVELGIRMLRAFYVAHPTEFSWRGQALDAPNRRRSIDLLAGTNQLTRAVEDGSIDALIAQWNADAARFREMVQPYLLYH